MNLTGRAARWLVHAIIPAMLLLAGCNSLRGLEHAKTMAQTKSAPMPVPAEQPAVEIPPIPKPGAPQVASRTPDVRDLMVRRKPAPPKELPPSPKPAEPAVFAPADLVGSDFPAVLHVLRRPDSVQTSALSVVWTYSEPSCTLQLFFYPEIKTRTFRLLKHELKSAAEGDAETKACMREMMAMKTDEPALP